ncbi:Xaa-Pro peptidase family protein [Sulfitobacter sp. F26204]|uniref:M24 family metallopeptidase n=1 Tax=Sulfitobacter sp. F26204 TaxID=2996014 RepID=UPI00225DF9C8|nr:Xaa-Pro peptidase family protein [Sulfitobacter sp. F26204]MCX7559040.1 Xaa-Pro peptidase family protein [Sulfitobacter sp. F26204]
MTRLEKLREIMRAQSVDLVALGPGAHLAWLTGVRPHGDERPLLFCVSGTGAAFLMPVLEAESARQQTDLPFHTWSDDEGPQAALAAVLVGLGAEKAQSIALDETMRADFAGLVQDALPKARRQFGASTVGALRMRKDAAEYAALKKAALVDDIAMRRAWSDMRAGMTEREVADLVRDSFKAQGGSVLFSIIGTGGNGAFPHHHTGDTVLKPGDAVVMDIGGNVDGYPSDMTRMAVIGTPPEGYLEVHAVVEAAVQAALATAKPGVKAHEVDDAARGVIEAAGYGDYFTHRTGHGLGVEIHEPPYITATAQVVLEEGMVFSIEPGIYLPDRFGIRLEDIVILRADGAEILSELPRDLQIIAEA